MFKYSLQYLIKHYVQITKFACVGLFTFSIYVLFFHITYDSFKLDYRIAVSIAYVITVVTHFLLHRTFTYKAKEQVFAHNLGKYFLMLGINYLVMLFAVWFVVNIIKISPYFGLIASTAATTLVNFFIMKYFVFGSRIKSKK